MVHMYRNRERNGSDLFDAFFGLFWLALGLLVVYGLFTASPLTLLLTVPLLLLWMTPIYAHYFRRYYEIRLSDEGSCEFRGPLGSKHLRAQQIISVQRNDHRAWRYEGDETEHTLLRFQGGSLVIVQPVDDFDDFLTRLQALNPAVEVRGTAPVSAPENA